MSTRFIRKESGTTKLLDRSTDAGVQYDTVDGKIKYNDAGTVRAHVTEDKTQTLSNKTLQGVPPVSLAAATLSLTQALHDGLYVIVNRAAGAAITLPAATGSGATFRIIVGTTLTSGTLAVAVANASDFMRGEAYTFVTTVASTFGTTNTGTVATESDTFTFNRTTTGLGTIGDFVEFVDIAPNVWAVEADYASSGTAATPFSAAV
jgi:hypothetical protein